MRFALLALALAFALLAVTVRAEDADFENDNDFAENQAESYDDVDQADEADEADDDYDDADGPEDADDYVDEEEKAGCSPEPRTETKTLGGKEIRQETENISVNGGCVRVLKGGNPSSYTMAGSCATCTSSGGHSRCLGAPLAMSRKCNMVLGPDCKRYSVDKSDPTKPCE
ncbi:hypothetical protein BOX15_Mlig025292g3 [Macrostomum lignano]|uniref:VWFC domain-containing protein n=1 Tax=Macrostomum lignano TaxID=282301 RepID=A0A267DTH6_9PLAT|nr:hypothetical protein BOX15_Mlig025292g3 [Macrostomum lignano]